MAHRSRDICGVLAAVMLLAGCASPPPVLAPGPLVARMDVVERDWHTDLCVDARDITGRLATLAAGFPGASTFCFGFGERGYMVDKDHSAAQQLTSLLPSEAALLVVALREPVEQAYRRTYPSSDLAIVSLRTSRAGAANFDDFVWDSARIGADGKPVRLREDGNADNVFYAASGTYNALATCNTWAAHGMRSAGLPVSDGVIFASEVMTQARKVAAAQASGP